MARNCNNGTETELSSLSLPQNLDEQHCDTEVNELLYHSELRQISLDHNLGKISSDHLLREFTRIMEDLKYERKSRRINQLNVLKVHRCLVEVQQYLPPALRPQILEVQYATELIDSNTYDQRLVEGLSQSKRELKRVVGQRRLDVLCQYQWSKAQERYIELINQLSIPRKAVIYALLENTDAEDDAAIDDHAVLEKAYGLKYSGKPIQRGWQICPTTHKIDVQLQTITRKLIAPLLKVFVGLFCLIVLGISLFNRCF